MQNLSVFKKIQEAVGSIQRVSKEPPQIGVILGSGLGSLANEVENPHVIPYQEIPYFHGTSVQGHAGKMVLGRLLGVSVVMLQGRFHSYEGYPMEEVVFPTRTLCALGIETLIVTNAAGGVNPRFRPADLMIIEDQINLMSDNPLRGPNIAEFGPRFPDMTEAYFRSGQEILQSCARELGIPIHSGVYLGAPGPSYETPAEIRMMRTLGADAVGMSTVPETIAARHLGVQVAGVSCITNLGAGMTSQKLSHEEVIENSARGAQNFAALLRAAIPQFAALGKKGK